MAHYPAPVHPSNVTKPPKAKPTVDIGTAIAINRQGPVKPGTNTPLKPKGGAGKAAMPRANVKWK